MSKTRFTAFLMVTIALCVVAALVARTWIGA